MLNQNNSIDQTGVEEDDDYLYGHNDNNDQTEDNTDPFTGVPLGTNSIDSDPLAGVEMSLDEAEQVLKQPTPIHSATRSPPDDTSNPAEVIAVTTSLKGMIHSYYASLRLKHFLSCKRIKWIHVDTNRDFITAQGLRNSELIEEWESNGILSHGSDGRLELPQCIIDGVAIGDDTAVFELEEDGSFDHIVNRSMCPECLSEQGVSWGEEDEYERRGVCEDCGRELGSIIPQEIYFASGAIEHMFADSLIEPEEPVPLPGTALPYTPHFRLVGDSNVNNGDIFNEIR